MLGCRPRISLLLPLLLVALAAPASAQTARTAAMRTTTASLLKTTLRQVAAAQARHHTARGAYAASVGPLGVRFEPGVEVDILAAAKTGWQGRATHRDHPGRSCVIFVGRVENFEAPRTDGDREMAGEEGVPLCDRMR